MTTFTGTVTKLRRRFALTESHTNRLNPTAATSWSIITRRGSLAAKNGKLKNLGIALCTIGLAVATSASAVTIRGSSGNDRVIGTKFGDHLSGGPGNDTVIGLNGPDRISGQAGRDRLYGNGGNDRIDAADNERDIVNCGPGRDLAMVDRGLDKTTGCEKLKFLSSKPVTKPKPTVRAPITSPGPPTPAQPTLAPAAPAPTAPAANKPGTVAPGAPAGNGFAGPADTFASTDAAYAAYQQTWYNFAGPWLHYYWSNVISGYTPVNWFGAVTQGAALTCGPHGVLTMRNNAQYCAPYGTGGGYGTLQFTSGDPGEDFIWWDDSWLFYNVFQEAGDGAVVGLLGHEYGHAVQYRLGWAGWGPGGRGYFTGSIAAELNADCLEGVFLYYMYNFSGVMDGAIASTQIGNFYAAYVSPTDPGDHGTLSQRINAINYGYQFGLDGCRTGFIF